MTRLALALLLLPLCSCSGTAPYVTTVGTLPRGKTLEVRVGSARLSVYQPASGQRRDLYTVAATALARGTPPPAPQVLRAPSGVLVDAPAPLDSLLVRVPDGVNLKVESLDGNVSVTDITGNAAVIAQHGDVDLKVPGYAQASVGTGNLSVMMGAPEWPGVLRFAVVRGDVELWIRATAAFGAHLHTDDGTLFTGFGLRGNSSGNAETIDGTVNGGSASRIDVEVHAGSIRLLRLAPQP